MIRVSNKQRELLRDLAQRRNASMTDTLDAALNSLRRHQFFQEMALAQDALRADPPALAEYTNQHVEWLNADLG